MKEAMKPANNGQITIGQSVTISNLEITNPQSVAIIKAAESDGRDVVEYVTSAVEIGVQALQVSSVTLGVEAITTEIANAQTSMATVTKNLNEDIKKQLSDLTGKEGVLIKSIEQQLVSFADELEKLTGGEHSPIREGIKIQLDALNKGLLDGFSRVAGNQRDEMAKLLDIENPQSPLRLLAANLKSVGDSVAAIQTKLDENKGAAVEAVRGTKKGGDYEVVAIEAVAEIARRSQDEPLATGGSTGKGTSKKGDGVVRLREGLSVKANLVVEAKDMSSKKTDTARLKYWSEQAEAARKNRNAIGFLGLCKNIEDMPGKQRIIALDKLGQNLVLAYDPEKGEDEFLALVYQVVKMHCLSMVSNGVEINPAAMSAYIQESFDQLKKLDAIDTAVLQIRKQANNISSTAEEIKDALTKHLNSIRRELHGSVQQLTLENEVQLALPETENELELTEEEFKKLFEEESN